MAEWSIAAVLKTVEGHTSGGSNPSLSAIKPDYQVFIVSTPNFTPNSCKMGCFLYSLRLIVWEGKWKTSLLTCKPLVFSAQAEITVHLLKRGE